MRNLGNNPGDAEYHKGISGVKALDNVNFKVETGEIHALSVRTGRVNQL